MRAGCNQAGLKLQRRCLSYAKTVRAECNQAGLELLRRCLFYAKVVELVRYAKTFHGIFTVDSCGRACRLLVGILNKTLIFGSQSTHDGLIALVDGLTDVSGVQRLWCDRFVNSQTQRVPGNPFHVTHARHNVERSVDGQWHDG